MKKTIIITLIVTTVIGILIGGVFYQKNLRDQLVNDYETKIENLINEYETKIEEINYRHGTQIDAYEWLLERDDYEHLSTVAYNY